MRYCRYLSAEGPRYANVEMRGGAAWAVSDMLPPEEDFAALRLQDSEPGEWFAAVSLAELQEKGKLLAPVAPSKIVCVGRNYRDHAAELGNDVPTEPLLFLKPPSALLAPGATVLMPAISKRVDFEGELAVVIGRPARRVDESEALGHVAGYCVFNDATLRDYQFRTSQWTLGPYRPRR